jgi:hypothetical protein
MKASFPALQNVAGNSVIQKKDKEIRKDPE